MNRNMVKEIIYFLIAIVLSILAVKFVIWLLPVILVVMLSLIIYTSMKMNKSDTSNDNIKEVFDYKDNKEKGND